MRLSRLVLSSLLLTAACSGGGATVDDDPADASDVGSDESDAGMKPDGAGDAEAPAEPDATTLDAMSDAESDHDAGALDAAEDASAEAGQMAQDAARDANVIPQGPEQGTLATVPGAESALARSSLPSVGPVVARVESIEPDGFLHTRLNAALAPNATVAQLNAALAQANATIASARPKLWSISLAVPHLADEAAARALAAQLMGSGAFVLVEPAWGEVGGQQAAPFIPPVLKSGDVGAHLTAPGFLAAWNASQVAMDQHEQVLVMVPDTYVTTEPDARIGGQRFGNVRYAFDVLGAGASVRGNHGFWTSGLLAAKPDNDVFTGTSPAPEALLDLLSLQIAGASWPEKLAAIADEFPIERKFIISVSQGYNDPTFVQVSRLSRALLALDWRTLIAPLHGRLLIAASAGNDGLHPKDPGATWNSPFTMQHATDDLRTLLTGAEATEFGAVWDTHVTGAPQFTVQRAHTLTVGSSDFDGVRSPFSSLGEDIRMIAQPARGICVATKTARSRADDSDPDCDAQSLVYTASGTSGAAPQLAGLAAYLWNLVPTMPVEQLHKLLRDTRSAKWAEAYTATLALENVAPRPAIRAAILDVTGTTGAVPDDAFTEHDVQKFLAAIAAGDGASDAAHAVKDFSRFDLNGDGFTRSDTAVPFDLDVDQSRTYTKIAYIEGAGDQMRTLRLDEKGITDLDVLCYYAWPFHYAGDLEARSSLLEGRCASNSSATPRKHFLGQVTIRTDKSYAFPSLSDLPGSGGRYPFTSSTTTVYRVDCAGASVPGACTVASANGSVARRFSTETPGRAQRGIGTNCDFMEFYSRTETAQGSGAISDTFNQQRITFEYPTDGSLSLNLNVFGVAVPFTRHDTSTINVLFGAAGCAGPGMDETGTGGSVAPGGLSTRFRNVDTAPIGPLTNFSGSFSAEGDIPSNAIDDPSNVSLVEVSWSMRLVED